MKKHTLTIAAAVVLLFAASNARAVIIDDTYWGAGVAGITNDNTDVKAPGQSGDTYGGVLYNISRMQVEISGSNLQVTVFSDNYFSKWKDGSLLEQDSPGDLFLSTNGWKPNKSNDPNVPSDIYYSQDNSTTGEKWEIAVVLDQIWDRGTDSGSANLYETGSGTIMNGYEGTRTAQEAWFEPSPTADKKGTGRWSYLSSNDSFYALLITMSLANLLDAGWDPSKDYLGLHWTMACGNDVIEGKYSPVPEPATILLFATGLAGLTGFARRRVKK